MPPSALRGTPARPSPGGSLNGDVESPAASQAELHQYRLFSSDAANNYYGAMTAKRAMRPSQKPPRAPKPSASKPALPKSVLKKPRSERDDKTHVSMRSSGSRISWKPSKDADDEESNSSSDKSADIAREGAGEARQPPSPPRIERMAGAETKKGEQKGEYSGLDTDTLDGFYGEDDSSTFRKRGSEMDKAGHEAMVDPLEATRLRQQQLRQLKKQLRKKKKSDLDNFYADETSDDVYNLQKLAKDELTAKLAEDGEWPEMSSGSAMTSGCSVVTEIVPKKKTARTDCSVVTEIVSKKNDKGGEKSDSEVQKSTISYDHSNNVLRIPAEASPLRKNRQTTSSKDSSGGSAGSTQSNSSSKLVSSGKDSSDDASVESKSLGSLSRRVNEAFKPPKSGGRPPKNPASAPRAPKAGAEAEIPSVAPKKIRIGGLLYKLQSGGSSVVSSVASSKSSSSAAKKEPNQAGTANVSKTATESEGGGVPDKLSLMKSVASIISDNSSEVGSRVSKMGIIQGAGAGKPKGDANAKSLKQLLTEALALSKKPEDIARYLVEHGGEQAVGEFLWRAKAESNKNAASNIPPVLSFDQPDAGSNASSVTHHGEDEKVDSVAGSSAKVMTPEQAAKLGSKGAKKSWSVATEKTQVSKEEGAKLEVIDPKQTAEATADVAAPTSPFDAVLTPLSVATDHATSFAGSLGQKLSGGYDGAAKSAEEAVFPQKAQEPEAEVKKSGADEKEPLERLSGASLNVMTLEQAVKLGSKEAEKDGGDDKSLSIATESGTDSVKATAPRAKSLDVPSKEEKTSKTKTSKMPELTGVALLAALNHATLGKDPGKAKAPRRNSGAEVSSATSSSNNDTDNTPNTEKGKEVLLEDYRASVAANDAEGAGANDDYVCHPSEAEAVEGALAVVASLATDMKWVVQRSLSCFLLEVEQLKLMDMERIFTTDEDDLPPSEPNWNSLPNGAPQAAGQEKAPAKESDQSDAPLSTGETASPATQNASSPSAGQEENEKEQSKDREEGQPATSDKGDETRFSKRKTVKTIHMWRPRSKCRRGFGA